MPDYEGARLAGAYCQTCRKAWRAIQRPGEPWKVIWDVSSRERIYVLNGKIIGEDDAEETESEELIRAPS